VFLWSSLKRIQGKTKELQTLHTQLRSNNFFVHFLSNFLTRPCNISSFFFKKQNLASPYSVTNLLLTCCSTYFNISNSWSHTVNFKICSEFTFKQSKKEHFDVRDFQKQIEFVAFFLLNVFYNRKKIFAFSGMFQRLRFLFISSHIREQKISLWLPILACSKLHSSQNTMFLQTVDYPAAFLYRLSFYPS